MKNRILLVGGKGYLGRHLEYHLADIAEVFVTGTSPRSDSNFFVIDYTTTETFKAVNQKFDLVIFLAASLTGVGKVNLDHPDLDINVIGFGKFLQHIIDYQVAKKFIYVSSMTVYAKSSRVPVEETSELQPLSIYGLSKALAEKVVEFAVKMNSLKGVVVRIPGLYGGDRNNGFIFNTYQLCAADKEVRLATAGLGYWECMDVEDLSRLLRDFILKYRWHDTFDVFNISYGEETDLINTAKKIKRYCNSSSPINVVDGKNYASFYLSNKKVARIITISSSFDLSLRRYIEKLDKKK